MFWTLRRTAATGCFWRPARHTMSWSSDRMLPELDGLSLVKAFVELHHGELQFESEPSGGTRVTVTFPAAAGVVIFARAV